MPECRLKTHNHTKPPTIESQNTIRMIGNVAHDLKTVSCVLSHLFIFLSISCFSFIMQPLSAFSGGLDLISDDMIKMEATLMILRKSDDKVSINTIADLITSVQQSIVNMRTVNTFMVSSVNRCIDYTKATTGVKLAPRPETVNIAEVLDFSLSCMRNAHSSVKVSLKPSVTTVKPAASHIITDKQWLQENILCLLSNAVRYSSRGDITLCAALCTRPCASNDDEQHQEQGEHADEDKEVEGEFLRLEVEDNGIGVSPEVAATLFQPFQQAQAMAGGTGLGLYSLALRVAALGGSYGVAARRDGAQGSVFWFDIPYRPDAAAMETSPQAVSGDTELALSPVSTPSSCSLNVLLVDDSQAILRITGALLKRQGHLVITAENGAEAVSQLLDSNGGAGDGDENHRHLFDVVLMDLQMPVMDGLEATRRIRQSEALHSSSSSKEPTSSCHLCSASTETVTETFSYIGLNHSASLDAMGFLAGTSGSSGVDVTATAGSRNSSPKSSANGHFVPSFRRAISAQLSASGTALQGLQQQPSLSPPLPTRRTVIIGVSANGDRDTVSAAYAAGVDAFIPKPFTMAQFNETYAAIMKEKALQKQQQQ